MRTRVWRCAILVAWVIGPLALGQTMLAQAKPATRDAQGTAPEKDEAADAEQ